MEALIKYFGISRLINLPTRHDRLREAEKELACAGTVLGTNGVQLYSAQIFTDRGKFPWNPSVRGCFHSHKECIRAAKREGKKSILILEDDIALSPSIDVLAPSIMAQLEGTRWGITYFSYRVERETKFAKSGTAEISLRETNETIETTSFYAINSSIFDRLLSHLDRVEAGVEGDDKFGPMPIDGAYNVFRKLNPDVCVLLAEPQIGWQRSSRSDITPSFIDEIEVLQPAVAFFRNVGSRIGRLFR